MARKITIKALCRNGEGHITLETITGELFEYGGFQFCVRRDDEYYIATEVGTGMIAHRVRLGWHRAPKQDLLAAVTGRIATNQMQKALDEVRANLEDERADLLARANAIPTIPINEPIKTQRK
jgi:hypothetical protein